MASYNIGVILRRMRDSEIGLLLARTRRQAGLTQTEVAARMRVPQPAISRAEAGKVTPSIPFLERFAQAVRKPLIIEIKPSRREVSKKERRRRVRRALGDYVFDPWERNPSKAEANSLISDGLTREYFERKKAARRSKA